MPLELILQIPYYALAGLLIIVFLYKDRNKKFSVVIFILIGLWIGGIAAERTIIGFEYLSEIFIGLTALFYLLRFSAYEQKRIIDWIKIPLVVPFALFETIQLPHLSSAVAVTIITLYVFDKTLYNAILTKHWKTALLIPFILTAVSMNTTINIEREERYELSELYLEEIDNRTTLTSKLDSCEINNLVLERELQELKTE